jgi:hypothetical protein
MFITTFENSQVVRLHLRGVAPPLAGYLPGVLYLIRGVAQLASVLAWGASGRPFESDHPDLKITQSSDYKRLRYFVK